jgi:hypothetical protein
MVWIINTEPETGRAWRFEARTLGAVTAPTLEEARRIAEQRWPNRKLLLEEPILGPSVDGGVKVRRLAAEK